MSNRSTKFRPIMRWLLLYAGLLFLASSNSAYKLGTSSMEQQTVWAQSKQAAVSKIYWTEPDAIKRANVNGTSIENLVVATPVEPQHIALDVPRGKMYWTDWRRPAMRRANLDGSSVEDLITSGLEIHSGIALDLIRNKMYWTDWDLDKIQRANLDGSGREDLVTTGLGGPEEIAVDAAAGKIYWTDRTTDKIQRADLNGTNVQDLISFGLGSPEGIALDVIGGKMYWTDSFTDKIQRANLDGSSVEDLVTAGLSSPRGIALDVGGGKMYWTDSGTDKIQRANLNGTNVEDIVTGLNNPKGIALALTCFRLSFMHTGLGANPTATPTSSIGCPTGEYLAGEPINLTAHPSAGWRVESWGGTNNDSSNAASNSLVMPSANWQVSVHYAQCPCHNFLPVATKPFFYGPAEREPNNDLAQANGLLISGQTYVGTMPNSGDRNDYYKFQLFENGSADIQLTNIAPGHNYSLTLRDSAGIPVPSGHSGQPGNTSERIGPLNLAAGLYYIQVNNTGATGSTQSYQLRAIFN